VLRIAGVRSPRGRDRPTGFQAGTSSRPRSSGPPSKNAKKSYIDESDEAESSKEEEEEEEEEEEAEDGSEMSSDSGKKKRKASAVSSKKAAPKLAPKARKLRDDAFGLSTAEVAKDWKKMR
jgi:hypothetical protein